MGDSATTQSELESGRYEEFQEERYFEFAIRRGERRARSIGQSAAPGA